MRERVEEINKSVRERGEIVVVVRGFKRKERSKWREVERKDGG